MVFGEIVEPSSRAMWDDDFLEYPEDEGSELHWDESLKVPAIIDKLFIGESVRILTLLQKCLLRHVKLLFEVTNAGLAFYKIENDSYVVTYKPQPDLIIGKITEKLIPWLEVAKNTYVLTSVPITSLQNCTVTDTSPCIIRSLSSKMPSTYPRLEVPNLVTGFGASILSLCIHKRLNCTLYIGFLEEVPLDSINTQALIDLLRYLGINLLNSYILEDKVPSNNLYM